MIDASACKSARRAGRMHVPRAGVHVGEHACTRLDAGMHIGEHPCACLVLACTSASMRASASCSHVCRQACVHVSRADLHIDVHACMCQVQAHRRALRASRLTCALAVSATRSHFITSGERPRLQTGKARVQANKWPLQADETMLQECKRNYKRRRSVEPLRRRCLVFHRAPQPCQEEKHFRTPI